MKQPQRTYRKNDLRLIYLSAKLLKAHSYGISSDATLRTLIYADFDGEKDRPLL